MAGTKGFKKMTGPTPITEEWRAEKARLRAMKKEAATLEAALDRKKDELLDQGQMGTPHRYAVGRSPAKRLKNDRLQRWIRC
jgi:hypothetical protein